MQPKIFLVILLIHASTISYTQAPIITSFSPSAANAGSTIVISGNNFNPSVNGNVVYFGGAVAPILSATTTQLTVAVPSAAGNKPISVTNTANNLTAFSSQNFRLTFTGGDGILSSASFGAPVSYATNAHASTMAMGDMDFDGKTDAVVIDNGGGSAFYMYIKKNTSTRSNISFTNLPLVAAGTSGANNVILSDVNGDAKLDIIATSWAALSIFKNKSSVGNISYDTPHVFNLTGTLKSAKAADFDGDGKTDIVLIDEHVLYVMKNNSSPGGFSFASPVAITSSTSLQPEEIEVADMDGDGKTDIAYVSFYGNNVAFLRNTSSGSNISFSDAGSVYLGSNANPYALSLGEIDGDGRLDIVTANYNSDNMTIIRNESKPGTIAYTAVTGLSLFSVTRVELGDVDGDGLADVVAKNTGFSMVSVYRNRSSNCNIQFDSKIDLDAGSSWDYVVADVNNDGKPEVNVACVFGLRIFKNTIAQNVTVCANASATINSTITGATYQWQQNTGGGFNNIANGGVFNGVNSAELQISNATASMNGNSFRCLVGNDTSNVINLIVRNSATPSVTITRCPFYACTEDTITFRAVTTNAGSNASYQWQVNNVNVGTNSPVFISADIASGSQVKCTVTSSLSCASPAIATATSTVTLNLGTCPAITNVCANSNVTLTSNITGTSYQWQRNTGSGYANVAEGSGYSGTNTANLLITNISTQQYGYLYRCVIGTSNSKVFLLKFRNTWTGATNTNWENAANWNCGVVPDQNTDVIINSGTIHISSNVTIRSLTLAAGANVIVTPGYTLTVIR